MTKINPKIFGTYDIRGKYPEEINEEVVAEISRNLRRYFGRLVIAHDNRLSSPALYRAAIKEMRHQTSAIKIIKVGLATTPMFYFLVKKLKAAGGLMITASHLPKNHNGLKIVDQNALSLSGRKIKKLLGRG